MYCIYEQWQTTLRYDLRGNVAAVLKSYDEELQQLLVLVEDEELLRQRVGATWEFLAATSIDQDVVELVCACECVWNDLLPRRQVHCP